MTVWVFPRAMACALVCLAACSTDAEKPPVDTGRTGGAGGAKDAGRDASLDASLGGGAGSGGSAGTGGADGSTGGSPGDAGAIRDVAPEVTEPAKPGPITVTATAVEGPTRWKYDAKGAYTLIHDDTCGDKLKSHYAVANQELTSRGLHVGFGAIAGFCAGDGDALNQYLGGYFDANPQSFWQQWDEVRKLMANGHEIVNHSWSHALDVEPTGLPAFDAGRWQMELDRSRQLLEQNLGVPIKYFIFPYDEHTDEQLAYLVAEGYAGARGGMPTDGVNAFDFPDPMRANFITYRIEPGDVPNALNKVATDAIAKGGWGMREVHGVGEAMVDGWEPIPIVQYRAHLDFLKQRVDAGELWVDVPTAVTRYRFARTNCTAPKAMGAKLVFGAPVDKCRAYPAALTFRVTIQPSMPITELVAIQGTEYVQTSAVAGGTYFVHADPTKGDVQLSGR